MAKIALSNALFDVTESGTFDATAWMWPLIWYKDKPVTLKFSDGSTATYHKGDRVIYPKQLEYYWAMFRYKATLFGGSKGPGKTTAMLRLIPIYLMFLAQNGHPGARGAVFCETYKAVMDRHVGDILAGKVFPSWMGTFNADKLIFYAHPEYGAWEIQFRNTTDYEEKEKSTQYAIIGIDESTNQEEGFFNHILSCMRWTTNGIPVEHCPVLLATNPIGIGLGWHIKRFVNPETRDKPYYDHEHEVWFRGHHFIQALPTDNPALSAAYLAELKNKPPKIRDAFYFGRWDVFESQFFDLDERAHIVRPFPTPIEWTYTLSLDYGFKHTACALVTATDPNGTTYVIDMVSCVNKTAREMKELMREQFVFKKGPHAGKPYPFSIQVCDPDLTKFTGTMEGDKTAIEIWNSPDRDAKGNITFAGYQFIAANNARKPGWQAMRDLFHYSFVEKEGADGRLEREPVVLPRLRIFRGLAELWQSLMLLQHKDSDPDDAEKTKGAYGPGEGDDEAEALRYNIMACQNGSIGNTEDYVVERRRVHAVDRLLYGDRVERDRSTSDMLADDELSIWAR